MKIYALLLTAFTLSLPTHPIQARTYDLSKNPELSQVQKKAQSDAYFQTLLGRAWVYGIGLKKDVAKGRSLLEKAVVSKHPLAVSTLCLALSDGSMIPYGGFPSAAETQQAQRFCNPTVFQNLIKLATAGDAYAQSNLSTFYALGEAVGSEFSPEKAVSWSTKAAAQKEAGAQYFLGRAYATGEGVKKNESKALTWYKAAAEQGHMKAQSALGYAYLDGKIVNKDLPTAIKWLTQAAEHGDLKAQFTLGNIYKKGDGVKKDLVQARRWLGAAAEQGFFPAIDALGELE